MKIAHVVESSLAGVGSHVLDLTEGLLRRGHEVHVAYSPRRQDRVFRHRIKGIEGLHAWPVELRKLPHPSDLRGVREVRNLLRSQGPFDLVHGHSSKGGAVARLAALTTGLPAVYTPHAARTMDPTASTLTRFTVGLAERLLAQVRGMVIAVSAAEAEHLVGIGLPRSRLRVVPNCVRSVELPSRSEARRRLGLPQDGLVVGFVGRLTPQKAPEVLVSAFYRVSRFLRDAVLAVVGDGPLRAPLTRVCEQLGIEERVRWLGERNGQLSMPAFDVLVLPSRYEGLPTVLLEALVAGLPIVTTPEASPEKVVELGVNGLLVPVENPDALADAVLYLLINDDARKAFGEASRLRTSRFRHADMVERTERVYLELVGRPARGRMAIAEEAL